MKSKNYNIQLNQGWNDKSLTPKASILIAANSLKITFEIDHRVEYDKSLNKLDFVEGLWRQDCFEIFLAEASGNRYQEFNFAPSGAVWSALFSNYRQLEYSGEELVQDIKLDSQVNNKHWSLKLELPIKAIKIENQKSLLINLTAVLAGEFYSWADIKSDKPDFHITGQFKKISLT